MNERELVQSVVRGDTTPSRENIDEAIDESFPASGAPSWWAGPALDLGVPNRRNTHGCPRR